MRDRWVCIVGVLWLATQGVAPVAATGAHRGGTTASQPATSGPLRTPGLKEKGTMPKGKTECRLFQQPTSQAGDEAALTTFRAAVAGYLELRKKVSTELPPMKVTPRASEINAASDALARAVQRGRRNARQGSFFTPAVGVVIRRQLERALGSTDRASVLALINEEPTTVKRPTIHMRFPSGGVLASSPAVLLQALPPLPKELEYRFIGRILILRDVEAALILDYLSPALPPS